MKYDFFRFFWKAGEEGAVAYLAEKTDINLVSELKDIDEFPFEFEVKEGELQDYLANNKAWKLMSKKLKEIIDANTPNKQHRWVRVKVKDYQINKTTIYFLPVFESKIDILDLKNTTFVEGTNSVINPCLSLKKVRKLSFFPKQDLDFDFISPYLFMSKEIKEDIMKNKLTGITFSRANLTNDIDEHFLKLEKAWEDEHFYLRAWFAANNETYDFLFSVDRYVRQIKKSSLIWIGRVAIQAELTPEDLEMEINELVEEEYNKNNLRRLFEDYDGNAASSRKEVVKEVIETLKGKTPIKDENGEIQFLSLPDLFQDRSQKLEQAALETEKTIGKGFQNKNNLNINAADSIFKEYRKIKNQIIDLDQIRKAGDELAGKKQRVKDEARVLIEDFEHQE